LTLIFVCSYDVLVIIRLRAMMLTYGNGTPTHDELSGGTAAKWVAPLSHSPEETKNGSLAALDGMPISSRYCSWLGRSGRRYVFSVYLASECPAFHDAILLAVVRDMTGRRWAISAHDTGHFPEAVLAEAQRELETFGPGLELHLHLLAASSVERAAALADLAVDEP
jgi:hypothetical protein